MFLHMIAQIDNIFKLMQLIIDAFCSSVRGFWLAILTTGATIPLSGVCMDCTKYKK